LVKNLINFWLKIEEIFNDKKIPEIRGYIQSLRANIIHGRHDDSRGGKI
jgi:hypothetical protein